MPKNGGICFFRAQIRKLGAKLAKNRVCLHSDSPNYASAVPPGVKGRHYSTMILMTFKGINLFIKSAVRR